MGVAVRDLPSEVVPIDFVFKDGTTRFCWTYCLDARKGIVGGNKWVLIDIVWMVPIEKELFGCKNKGNSDGFIVQNSKRRSIM